MQVTFEGNPLTLKGTQLNVGDDAKDFTLVANDLSEVTLKDTKGKRVFVVVPSIDTPVCDMEVRRFNKEATNHSDVTIYTISMDLPFAQARWCGSAGVSNVITLSDYKHRNFGENYGVLIEELGLLSRAIFIIDENNKVIYTEYCKEITSEPNYDMALAKLK